MGRYRLPQSGAGQLKGNLPIVDGSRAVGDFLLPPHEQAFRQGPPGFNAARARLPLEPVAGFQPLDPGHQGGRFGHRAADQVGGDGLRVGSPGDPVAG